MYDIPMPVAMEDESRTAKLSANLIVEDHGSEIYLISESEGHDLTFSLEAPVAERLARFILSRRDQRAALGGKESRP